MTRRSRPIEVVRAAWGALLLAAPQAVLSSVPDDRVDHRGLVVARILGARHLVQAVLSGVRPSPEVVAMGVWVDATHALCAATLAALDPGRAAAALTDTAVAGGWALAGYHDLAHAPGTPPGHDRRRDELARAVLGAVPGGGPLARRAKLDRDESPGATA